MTSCLRSEAEVDIDIRHGNPFRVQETLKQQAITDRINIRDMQAVGNDASSCTSTSRSYQECRGSLA